MSGYVCGIQEFVQAIEEILIKRGTFVAQIEDEQRATGTRVDEESRFKGRGEMRHLVICTEFGAEPPEIQHRNEAQISAARGQDVILSLLE